MAKLTPEIYKNLDRNFLVVDLAQAEKNAAALKQLAGKSKLAAVVKADAYGHGLLPCARAFLAGGADYLAVATGSAALTLRKGGITAPILLFSEAEQLHYPELVAAGINISLYSAAAGRKLQAAAQLTGRQGLFHLAIDTGMSRIGFDSRLLLSALPQTLTSEQQDACPNFKLLQKRGFLLASLTPAEAENAAASWTTILEVLQAPELRCNGMFSHLAFADCVGEEAALRTERQKLLFSAFKEVLAAMGYKIPLCHLAQSAGALRYPACRFDMIRPGSLLYGLPPANCLTPTLSLVQPIASWYAKFARIFRLPPHTPVSYGGLWQSEREVLIGVLAVGYADGYRRNLSSKAYVILPQGEKAPIRGRICMDYCMVELPETYAVYLQRDLSELQPAELLGDGSRGEMTAWEMAAMADSFDLEVTCSITARVPRIYLRNGQQIQAGP